MWPSRSSNGKCYLKVLTSVHYTSLLPRTGKHPAEAQAGSLARQLTILPRAQSSVGSTGSAEQRVTAQGRPWMGGLLPQPPDSQEHSQAPPPSPPCPLLPACRGSLQHHRHGLGHTRQHLLLVSWVHQLAGGAERPVRAKRGQITPRHSPPPPGPRNFLFNPKSQDGQGLCLEARSRAPQGRACSCPGPAALRPAGLLRPLCPTLLRPVRAPLFPPLIGLIRPSSSNILLPESVFLFLDLPSWASLLFLHILPLLSPEA